MSFTSARIAELPPGPLPVPGNEISVIGRREIEPLLAKAGQLLSLYDEATNSSSAVLDRTGQVIKSPKYKNQMRFCELCRKYNHDPLPAMKGAIWEEYKCPCEKIHGEAITESRFAGKTYIYTCPVGLAYWTTPLYRNGRYAGALMSGQILICGRKKAVEKFFALCKDSFAAEKFNNMLEDVPEKTHAEIQSMVNLLGLCAGEISESGEDPGKTIRRMAWNKETLKGFNEAQENVPKKNPLTQMEEERMLLAAFQRGDTKTGNRILTGLMESIIAVHPQNIEIIRYRAIELLVFLSRATLPADNTTMFDDNDRNMKRLQESKTTAELMENLQFAIGRMAGKIFSFQGIRHASVLRKAQRYIWDNYTRKISLEEISKASGLSAPYFSTIFNEEMGENLTNYLNRLRVEKAAAMLTETGKSLNDITKLCGFEDQSWFSKVFKSFVGVSPGKYRETGNIGPEKKYAKRKMFFLEKTSQRPGNQNMMTS